MDGAAIYSDVGVLTSELTADGTDVVPRVVRAGFRQRPEVYAAVLVLVALVTTGVLRRTLGGLIPGYRNAGG
jgi:hypothetical protein